uniref:Uncharacterized protein n=1 Tax=Aureoumbra lagunensis TaxID=44058 RepID=A0A7S3JQ37_9STRA|mmetsp:Transcript_12915/g.19349  ORF Transcript_12915/g.19349 Transcript_12915/m.19349 type:complete len:309 (-) Transcript_12915:126-1052(-)|eukprot:CAMPEP_0197322048 /NCGR_PEP_ID=MMETSP0891-20130614/67878_1 /TAXON_ID=44058 ORGANISM="Aureoumbra lagunensis, Strain CCMP1510" /NCGR_SAMPLE_ID=MMETSP0891 /ASSEMBLY_ACC=CAM_ASM_000534 /LENGTH=308 /DNA_ID=CAMNT_0042814255 /DNA_START=53 /DNA_END=976 /DNA_ORIENTATION=-
MEKRKYVEVNKSAKKDQREEKRVKREEYNFEEFEDEDHCETPETAYADIIPALEWLARRLGKDKGTLKIYDPYYCAGGVKKRLKKFGFDAVQNTNIDCYKTWFSIEYDTLVTNPPYSGDHIDRLLQFCLKSSKPFFLCVPLWVHKRPLLQKARQKPIFISPRKRYVYQPPPHLREKKKSDTHKKTAPFHSIWIIWAGSQNETDQLARYLFNNFFSPRKNDDAAPRLARSRSQLRDLRRTKKIEGEATQKRILPNSGEQSSGNTSSTADAPLASNEDATTGGTKKKKKKRSKSKIIKTDKLGGAKMKMA